LLIFIRSTPKFLQAVFSSAQITPFGARHERATSPGEHAIAASAQSDLKEILIRTEDCAQPKESAEGQAMAWLYFFPSSGIPP
jgi:hypothetical protein